MSLHHCESTVPGRPSPEDYNGINCELPALTSTPDERPARRALTNEASEQDIDDVLRKVADILWQTLHDNRTLFLTRSWITDTQRSCGSRTSYIPTFTELHVLQNLAAWRKFEALMEGTTLKQRVGVSRSSSGVWFIDVVAYIDDHIPRNEFAKVRHARCSKETLAAEDWKRSKQLMLARLKDREPRPNEIIANTLYLRDQTDLAIVAELIAEKQQHGLPTLQIVRRLYEDQNVYWIEWEGDMRKPPTANSCTIL